jgi:hypothetical protein
LDEEVFPYKPEAQARESVLLTQQNSGNAAINERDMHIACRTVVAARPFHRHIGTHIIDVD